MGTNSAMGAVKAENAMAWGISCLLQVPLLTAPFWALSAATTGQRKLLATAPQGQHEAEHLSHAPKWAKTRCECARLASQGHPGSAGAFKIAASLKTGLGRELLLSSLLRRVKAVVIPLPYLVLGWFGLRGPNKGVQLRVALLGTGWLFPAFWAWRSSPCW